MPPLFSAAVKGLCEGAKQVLRGSKAGSAMPNLEEIGADEASPTYFTQGRFTLCFN
jgi:hypothetical protein